MRYVGKLLWMVSLVTISLGPLEAHSFSTSDQVQIENVSVMMSKMGPVVLLKAHQGVVPIFVDPTVADSIDGALSGVKFPRPLSHDLMHSILDSYGGKVSQVVIRLRGQVYYGELTISWDGQTRTFDSRSSDAIALAIHFKAPIWVGKDLLEEEGEKPQEPGGRQVL